MVTVGLSSVVVDKHGASKDNNSAVEANNELNTSSDSSSSSSGPLVEFSSSQSNAKEARSVKWGFYKGLLGLYLLCGLPCVQKLYVIQEITTQDTGKLGDFSILRC